VFEARLEETFRTGIFSTRGRNFAQSYIRKHTPSLRWNTAIEDRWFTVLWFGIAFTKKAPARHFHLPFSIRQRANDLSNEG
jgi:hypothetical protein